MCSIYLGIGPGDVQLKKMLFHVGDEIEVVFGVPVRQADHADKAVLAAVEMRKSLAKLNAHRIRSGRTLFQHWNKKRQPRWNSTWLP
jgi:hypothetical protein